MLAIRAVARRTGADVQALMTLYALEGLLARISISEHRNDFVLKGGVLLAAFAARRPTKDIDLHATNVRGDTESVTELVREIASLNEPDGLMFAPGSVSATSIRDRDEYAGVRVKLTALLGSAQLTVGVDINFGDPIWPPPRLIQLPRLVGLGLPPVALLGCPLSMVLAEKVVTAVDRGAANTRWRDFGDLYVLARLHGVDADEFRASLDTVADYRGVDLTTLLPRLESMGERAQPKWRAWLVRSQRGDELPEAFADVLAAVAHFVDPVLSAEATGRWNPAAGTWI